ncbi:hypothetical protein ABIB37_000314 [Agrococcus sp. UYP10]|uniref:hypothetical protein n=1 Tax=Agrococcus sp. UYP10 TaxID=1756355 RepID=UPI0033915126
MASARRSALVGVIALAMLTACTPTPAAPSASPTPSTTPTPSATPTQSATPTPTPSEAPSPAPAASATPPASASATWPRCADGVVRDPEAGYTVSWNVDTYEEQIAASDPRTGFEPEGLLDSDGVLCSVVYDHPVDGPGAGVGRFSTAIVRDADMVASVQAWAAEHGYEPLESGGETTEYVLGAEDDIYDARLHAYVLGDPADGTAELENLERRSGLDLEPTDVLLTHVAFETEQ